MIQIKLLSLFHIVCHLTYQSETYYAGKRQKAAWTRKNYPRLVPISGARATKVRDTHE